MQKKNRLWIIIVVLATVSLACNLSIFSPKTPAPPIPVTTEAVQSLKKLHKMHMTISSRMDLLS